MTTKSKSFARQSFDMTQGNVVKQVILFTIPLLIGNLFQQMYNMVDSMVVGNVNGPQALAAVGTAGNPMQVLLALFLGVGTGATILVSQYCGAGSSDELRQVVKTANTFLIASSIPVTIAGLLLSAPLLRVINVPDDVFPMAQSYLMLIFLGTVANLGYNLNSGILRGIGDSRSPLIFLIYSSVMNTVLDLLFVAVFRWGVNGAAIATILSQYFAWIYSIYFMKKHYPELGMDMNPKQLHMERGHLRDMVKLGLPLGFNNAVYSLGHVILYGLINSFGSIFMAGNTAATRVDGITFMVIASFGTTATTFAGQNAGARKFDRMKKGIWSIMGITCAFNVVLSVLLLLFGPQIIALFNRSPEVVEAGYDMLVRLCPYYIIYTIFHIFNCYMNGAGEVNVPTLASLIMFWLVRLPLAYVLVYFFAPKDLYYCYPISWLVGLLISGPYYFSGRWKRKIQMQ